MQPPKKESHNVSNFQEALNILTLARLSLEQDPKVKSAEVTATWSGRSIKLILDKSQDSGPIITIGNRCLARTQLCGNLITVNESHRIDKVFGSEVSKQWDRIVSILPLEYDTNVPDVKNSAPQNGDIKVAELEGGTLEQCEKDDFWDAQNRLCLQINRWKDRIKGRLMVKTPEGVLFWPKDEYQSSGKLTLRFAPGSELNMEDRSKAEFVLNHEGLSPEQKDELINRINIEVNRNRWHSQCTIRIVGDISEDTMPAMAEARSQTEELPRRAPASINVAGVTGNVPPGAVISNIKVIGMQIIYGNVRDGTSQ